MVDYASQIRLPDYSRLASGVQGLIGLQGNLLQQRALTQQMEANKAASEAAKLSTDPVTGQIDQAKFTQLLSQGAGAYNIPEYLGKFQQLSNAQLEAKAKQLDIAQKQLSFFGGQLGSLVNMGERATPQDVIRTLANGVQLGMMTPEQAQQYATQIPSDPKELQPWLRQHWIGLQRTQEQIGLLPQGGTVDTGGAQIMTNRDPISGQISTAAVVPKTLTPGEASANVTVIDPNTGAQYQITKEQQLRMQGQPAGSQGYTGRLPSGAASAVPGGVLSGLGPAEQARMSAGATAQATQAATAAQGVADAAADAPMRLNLLEQARDSLSNIQTGPGTDWRNTAASFINSLTGGMAAKLGVTNPNEIASYDEFKKILTNYASSISGSMGSGTDARLNAAITGNANPNISKLANEDILTKTIAAERMRQAQAYAFQNSGQPPDKFTQWQTQWNKEVNPDAFVFTSMTPAQQQKFISRKSKDGSLGKFKSDLAKLVRSGVIEMPGRPDAGAL